MIKIKNAKNGCFLEFYADNPFSERTFEYELSFDEFLCSYRDRPYFMSAATGNSVAEIPPETQFLLTKKENEYMVLFPLSADVARASVSGGEKLLINVETGDCDTKVQNGICAYTACSENPYELIRTALAEIKDCLGTFKLRDEKYVPEFMKYFGWCTWNAMGIDVSGDKVVSGIESFGEHTPKFVLLDDGWQTTNNIYANQGQWKLSSFKCNGKIEGGLKALVEKCREMGVENFYVWHALMGYWGGIDPESSEMAKYMPELKFAKFNDNLHHNNEECCKVNEIYYGLAANDKIFDFYNDYHKYLAGEGIDGVKVDTQYYGEAVASGRGGRCCLYQKLREGLEASAQLNFGGGLINCMSAGNDITYRLKASNMTRTSDDFYPEIPSSHGQHIFKNAVNSLFTRDITYCDWDMFMTCHDYGAYHAAARAVSGGPVYVTDKIGEHDFNVISALRMSDGTVPLCCDIAVPSPDCLMTDPTVSDKAYMLINRNKFGSVCGAFNLNAEGKVVSGDVDGIYYSFMKQGIVAGGFELAERGFDIFTKADIKDGFGVFGLTRFYNMGGTVKDFRVIDGFAYIELADVGEVALFCETEPSAVLCGDEAVDFTYDGGVVKFAADNHEIIIKK